MGGDAAGAGGLVVTPKDSASLCFGTRVHLPGSQSRDEVRKSRHPPGCRVSESGYQNRVIHDFVPSTRYTAHAAKGAWAGEVQRERREAEGKSGRERKRKRRAPTTTLQALPPCVPGPPQPASPGGRHWSAPVRPVPGRHQWLRRSFVVRMVRRPGAPQGGG